MSLGGLPPDTMHDILGGIAPSEIRLLLCHFISNKGFMLNKPDNRSLHFDYGYSVVNEKPVLLLNHVLHEKENSCFSITNAYTFMDNTIPDRRKHS